MFYIYSIIYKDFCNYPFLIMYLFIIILEVKNIAYTNYFNFHSQNYN